MPLLRLKEDIVHDQNFSNRIAFVPSKNAIFSMLKHVGFREIFCVQNSSNNVPDIYKKGAWGTFIAVK